MNANTLAAALVAAGLLTSLSGTASAASVSVPLSKFVIFSHGGASASGGNETSIGGHTWVTGDIGSNQDLFQQGNPVLNYPAQLDGSAYAGGTLTFGQDLTVGSVSSPRIIIVNGAATIGGDDIIFGALHAASYTLGSGASISGLINTTLGRDTFTPVVMPAATLFTAGGVNQTIPTGQGNSLTLTPGTYGALATSSQNQSVVLSSGNYYFDSITSQGGFSLKLDLTSGNAVKVYLTGDAALAGKQTLLVKGAGTGGAFVPIDQAPQLASLFYMETYKKFSMTGGVDNTHNIWGGTLYASLLETASAEIDIGQYTDWYGAAYAYDSLAIADHGKWTHVPLTTTVVPLPTSLHMVAPLCAGLAACAFYRRKS